MVHERMINDAAKAAAKVLKGLKADYALLSGLMDAVREHMQPKALLTCNGETKEYLNDSEELHSAIDVLIKSGVEFTYKMKLD